MCKQIRFKSRYSEWNDDEILGGIGIYNDDGTLVNVICGCCGEMLEPGEVVIVEVSEYWVDITEEIIDAVLGT